MLLLPVALTVAQVLCVGVPLNVTEADSLAHPVSVAVPEPVAETLSEREPAKDCVGTTEADCAVEADASAEVDRLTAGEEEKRPLKDDCAEEVGVLDSADAVIVPVCVAQSDEAADAEAATAETESAAENVPMGDAVDEREEALLVADGGTERDAAADEDRVADGEGVSAALPLAAEEGEGAEAVGVTVLHTDVLPDPPLAVELFLAVPE